MAEVCGAAFPQVTLGTSGNDAQTKLSKPCTDAKRAHFQTRGLQNLAQAALVTIPGWSERERRPVEACSDWICPSFADMWRKCARHVKDVRAAMSLQRHRRR